MFKYTSKLYNSNPWRTHIPLAREIVVPPNIGGNGHSPTKNDKFTFHIARDFTSLSHSSRTTPNPSHWSIALSLALSFLHPILEKLASNPSFLLSLESLLFSSIKLDIKCPSLAYSKAKSQLEFWVKASHDRTNHN